MPRLLIYGSGGFGREMLLPLRQMSPANLPGEIAFVDDASTAHEHAGVPVIRFSEVCAGDYYTLAIANSRIREKLDNQCRMAGLRPWALIAPSAELGAELAIGEGALLCSKTVLTGFATIGRQFHCNIYSYVAHDCLIGDYVTFGPSVQCNGNVHVRRHAYIGAGAVIKQGTPDKPLVIGEGAIVGMGAIVTKDVPPHTTVVGNPARRLARPRLKATAARA